MRLRSLLFVPGDSERKAARALQAGADAVILDLEDSVAAARKTAARGLAAEILAAAPAGACALFVRINPLGGGLAVADLCAVVRPGLAGIVLPKAEGGADIARVGYYLEALEARAGLVADCVRILPIATETPAGVLALSSYAPAHPRLAGLSWGAEDLAACLGAAANREADGGWTEPYRMARAHCLVAAAAAGVPAIDTVFTAYRDMAALSADCARARRDGFAGRMAVHPDQVAAIHAGFAPSAAEIERARRVVAAFAAAPDAGVVGLDGMMLDLPHLKAARHVLELAGAV